MIRSLFASALLALAAHAAPTVLPNGAVMTPNDEVLRRQPVATDVSSLYARPSGGIPDSDLSAGVRGSLGRADTALQEHQSLAPVTNYADSLFGQLSGRVDGISAYTGVLESQKRNKRDLSAGWAWATDDPDCPPALVAVLNALGVVPNPVEIAGTGNWSWGVGEILTNGVFACKGFDTTAPIDAASVTIDFSDRKSDHTGRFYATARRIDALALRSDVSAATNGIRSVDGSARPLPRYLHALDFDDCYPDDAAWYYAQPQDYGSCSAVRDGGFMYRTDDWKLDDAAEFVVRVPSSSPRFASVGVANVGTNLTESFVTSGKPSRYYKCLPGRVVDGINENGVVCEVNVVDGDPPEPTGGDIHPLGAVRWALDHGKSAEDAATNLAARISFPSGWTQNFHWMVADELETWIVENGVASNVTEVAAKRVMTNFEILPDTYSGMGTERYQILRGGNNITNAWYTRAYRRETNPPWVSDLAEVLDRTNEIFNAWATHPKEHFRGQLNNGKPWWQTVHTSVYDITNRVLRVAVQETDDWYVFALAKNGTDEATVAAIANRAVETNGVTVALVAATNSLTAKVAAKADKATTLAGYGITNGATKAELSGYLPKSGGAVTGNLDVWGGLSSGQISAIGGIFTDSTVDAWRYSIQGRKIIDSPEEDQLNIGYNGYYMKLIGATINFASQTYVSATLYPLSEVKMRVPENLIFRDIDMNLIELIESYLHADANSGLSVTDPSYSFANLSRTATISAPHIPTKDNPVVTSQGTLTYDGTNYWLNGETQYNRDVAGDVKASVTLDQQMLTNVVTAVKSYHYDETLGVTWKMVPDDGHIYLIAVTNANVVTQ